MFLPSSITPTALGFVRMAVNTPKLRVTDVAFNTQAIIARQPHNPIGWLCGVIAVVTPVALATGWVLGWIDRRFYRKKYAAQLLLGQFTLTTRDETDIDALAAELVRVVQRTLQPEHVTICLQPLEKQS